MLLKVFLGLCCGVITLAGCSGSRPSLLGVQDGHLALCPQRPNCVSSQAKDPKHFIAPFSYAGDRGQAVETLKRILSTQQRATLVEERENYLYAEFTSKIFKFVDDVEFYFPMDQPVVHVRSASRLGYSDLGVNTKRVERLRAIFSKAMLKTGG